MSIEDCKCRWTGHVARVNPREMWYGSIKGKIPSGVGGRERPRRRWGSDTREYAETNWT